MIGVSGLRKITFNAALPFSGRRNLHLFSSMDEAKGIILSDRGKHFDPDVVDAFLSIEDRFLRIVAEHNNQ